MVRLCSVLVERCEVLLTAVLAEAEKRGGGKPSAELVQSLNSLAVVLTELNVGLAPV